MSLVFADTSFYIALISARDSCHDQMVQISNDYRGDILTTEYVLIELGNYLCGISRIGFLNFVHALRQDSRTSILPSSPALFEHGLQLYAQRQDKGWSLTDCISFAVMHQQDIKTAFTLDHHFEQSGFLVLPKM
jgi:uncharacterized protein